jgi:hypothetical protein
VKALKKIKATLLTTKTMETLATKEDINVRVSECKISVISGQC